ncbi:hypothetical protein [Promineifilum sp.]|uniref:hypothetical protein n=1 Tax=Promineifilum sp. TaxID=2664178 RepID=UPI0035B30FAD
MTTSTPLPTSTPAGPPAPANEQSQGLICPNCAGVVPVAEGVRVVQCPYCNLHSLVQGERGVRRWQVARRIGRTEAEAAARGFFSGMRKARDLARTARIDELVLVYLPFWRVEATVAGWLFGRVRKDKDSTKPDEHYVFESMEWNDAAVDVAEFGVHRIVVARDDLHPFDSQALHAEAMVFEPSESRTEAQEEARRYFIQRSRNAAGQVKTTYENIQLLRPDFALVYFPVWLIRYSYRNRTYQVVVDGAHGEVMYGKAPGNILYRAMALVAGLAVGNLVLVNGTILAAMASSDDDSLGLLLLPIALGIGMILYGYRQFRYGEEVEDKPRQFQKLQGGGNQIPFGEMFSSFEDLPQMMRTGMTVLEDLEEMSRQGRFPGKS